MLQRTVGRACALRKEHVDRSAINYWLLKICLDFGLIRDMEEFILSDLNPNGSGWTSTGLSYKEHLTRILLSNVRLSRVDKFPRYPRPAYFKNKQKNEIPNTTVI